MEFIRSRAWERVEIENLPMSREEILDRAGIDIALPAVSARKLLALPAAKYMAQNEEVRRDRDLADIQQFMERKNQKAVADPAHAVFED